MKRPSAGCCFCSSLLATKLFEVPAEASAFVEDREEIVDTADTYRSYTKVRQGKLGLVKRNCWAADSLKRVEGTFAPGKIPAIAEPPV